MKLRKPTVIKRRTIGPTGRVVVPPEPDAPPGGVRRVQLVLPHNPEVYVAIEPSEPWEGDLPGVDDAGTRPEDVAYGRVHQFPWLLGGWVYKFCLRPEQALVALTERNYAMVTVICEYLTEDG